MGISAYANLSKVYFVRDVKDLGMELQTILHIAQQHFIALAKFIKKDIRGE